MAYLKKKRGADKKNGTIKKRDKTPGIMGISTFFTKVASGFPKIRIMEHYQGGTKKFWEDDFLKK